MSLCLLKLRVLSLYALASILVAASTPAAPPEVLDGVAAVVNGDVITFSQVRELVSAREKALRSTYSGTQLAEKIKEDRM